MYHICSNFHGCYIFMECRSGRILQFILSLITWLEEIFRIKFHVLQTYCKIHTNFTSHKNYHMYSLIKVYIITSLLVDRQWLWTNTYTRCPRLRMMKSSSWWRRWSTGLLGHHKSWDVTSTVHRLYGVQERRQPVLWTNQLYKTHGQGVNTCYR